jgi:protein-disulfide isomerase
MKNTIIYAFSIVIAGALIGGALIYSKSPAGPGALVTPTAVTDEGKAAVLDIEEGDAVLGNPEAPVAIFNFSDFQCGFCGRHALTTEKAIIEKYVKTGKVKLVFRNFAFLGENSFFAAEAVECAKDQNKLWQFQDYLFANQDAGEQNAFTKDNLKKFAAALGLDSEQFNACLDSEKYAAKVKNSAKEGSKYGVISTPTNFIGKLPITVPDAVIKSVMSQSREYSYDLAGDAKLIIGAQPFSAFEETIEKLLK